MNPPAKLGAKKMQMAFYSIPARGNAGLQEDLNHFLRSHRALTVHREFVGQDNNSFWALAVEFLDGSAPPAPGIGRGGKERVDYNEVLSPADFAVFAKLRDWRKKASEAEAIPVYAILTNEQLTAIATKRPASAAQLREIEGIGEAKAGKYGEGVLGVVSAGGSPSVATVTGANATDTEVVPPGSDEREIGATE